MERGDKSKGKEWGYSKWEQDGRKKDEEEEDSKIER